MNSDSDVLFYSRHAAQLRNRAAQAETAMVRADSYGKRERLRRLARHLRVAASSLELAAKEAR